MYIYIRIYLSISIVHHESVFHYTSHPTLPSILNPMDSETHSMSVACLYFIVHYELDTCKQHP